MSTHHALAVEALNAELSKLLALSSNAEAAVADLVAGRALTPQSLVVLQGLDRITQGLSDLLVLAEIFAEPATEEAEASAKLIAQIRLAEIRLFLTQTKPTQSSISPLDLELF